ncbi:MAG TPA: hypothetical protein VID47_16460 [Actinomycetota bacterium]
MEPVSLVGVEQEYRVLLDGQPVDFRWLIGRLSIDGQRIDPGDPLALRCAWGGVVTADDAEAEIAIPPVAVERGWTAAVERLLGVGRRELAGALPEDFALDGYSTHLSFAMPDSLNLRVCRLLVSRFGPALMLMTGTDSTPGILVRPRPTRTEIGLEHTDGELLRAASTFAAGAVRVCAAAAAGDRLARRSLPPPLRAHVEPAIRRFGFYVDRTAFGGDLLRDARDARLRGRTGRRVTGQRSLEAAWDAARRGLVGADAADIDLLDAMVVGALPLPAEGLDLPAGRPHPRGDAAPSWSPFGEALRPYRSRSVQVRPLLVTWDFVVFEASSRGGVAFACIPREHLEAFVGALHRGRVDGLIEEFVASDRAPRTLADHAQTGDPGLYHAVGDPGRLLPPEREPGGRGGTAVPGGRRSKQRSRRAERPRSVPPPVPPESPAPQRPKRGVLVGVVAAIVILVGAVAAFAITRGGGSSTPVAAPGTGPSAAASGSTDPTAGPQTSAAVPPSTPSSPTDAPTPSTNPSPTQTVAPPTALSGVYNVTVKVAHLGSRIVGVHVGQSRKSSWILSTDCAKRPCALRLIGESRTGSKIDATGPFLGRTVRGSADSGLQCEDNTGRVLFVFDQTGGPFVVHVTNVQRVANIPQATTFEGSFHFTWVPPAGQATTGCEKTDETDTVVGTIRQAPVPAPLPSGAAPPPVADAAMIGTWDTTLHVASVKGMEGRKAGDDLERLYSFLPGCRAATGCQITLIRESGDGIVKQELKPGPDGSYAQIIHTTLTCTSGKASYLQRLVLKVNDAALVAGVWRATRMSGVFETRETPEPGSSGCTASHELDRITGTAQI